MKAVVYNGPFDVSVTDVPNVLDLTDLVHGRQPGDITAHDLAAVAQAARDHVEPVDDIHASADYRRHLSGILCRRVFSGLVKQLTEQNQHENAEAQR